MDFIILTSNAVRVCMPVAVYHIGGI